jgi:hypothetical protein
MRTPYLSVFAAVLLVVACSAASAGAAGYWNVPSTFCQCMNVGWGAGYHACLVLGPINCDGLCDHKELRVPYPPTSSPSCCGHCCRQPSRLNAVVVAAPTAPAPMPGPVQSTAIFAAPIER